MFLAHTPDSALFYLLSISVLTLVHSLVPKPRVLSMTALSKHMSSIIRQNLLQRIQDFASAWLISSLFIFAFAVGVIACGAGAYISCCEVTCIAVIEKEGKGGKGG